MKSANTVGESWRSSEQWRADLDRELQRFDGGNRINGMSSWAIPSARPEINKGVGRHFPSVDRGVGDPDDVAGAAPPHNARSRRPVVDGRLRASAVRAWGNARRWGSKSRRR